MAKIPNMGGQAEGGARCSFKYGSELGCCVQKVSQITRIAECLHTCIM